MTHGEIWMKSNDLWHGLRNKHNMMYIVYSKHSTEAVIGLMETLKIKHQIQPHLHHCSH